MPQKHTNKNSGTRKTNRLYYIYKLVNISINSNIKETLVDTLKVVMFVLCEVSILGIAALVFQKLFIKEKINDANN
jgi:hypothetical protein